MEKLQNVQSEIGKQVATQKLKKYYVIEGFDATNLIFRKEIPVGCITDNELINLVKCLTAKAALNFDEIIGGYVKKRTKLHHTLLDIYKDQNTFEEWIEYHKKNMDSSTKPNKTTKLRSILYSGLNPHFTATVIKK